MYKKLAICVIFLLSMTSVFAQTQDHIKFMGIPLNGTINLFQAKLAQKGVKVDAVVNKSIGKGCRAFKGSFSGKNAQIYVYYDESTMIVYRAKAVIEALNESINDDNYSYFSTMLSAKYIDAVAKTGEVDSHESKTFLILNNSSDNPSLLGEIDVYCSNFYNINFFVHVDYTDLDNSIKRESRNLDDL